MAGKCPPLLLTSGLKSGSADHLVRSRILDGACIADDGLAEPLPDLLKLLQLGRGKLGVPLRHILHRLLEPYRLMLRRSLEDAATVDVAHQLVTCRIELSTLVPGQWISSVRWM